MSGFEDLARDLRTIAAGPGPRAERARRAAEAIGRIGSCVHAFTHSDRVLLEAAADALAPLWRSDRRGR